MDTVTFIAILTLATGQPFIWQTKVPSELCQKSADDLRREHKHAIAWCPDDLADKPLYIAR
jgi:hypothetical protein